MTRNWRSWLLLILLVGPVLVYIGLGALWLKEKGWLLLASSLWIASGIVFAILASRWTMSTRRLLPPIDWDAPETFSPFDRQAWKLVEEEAERGETITMETLSEFDIYMETGRRLARRLAEHYHPLSNDPIEHVPVVELLTALELAAEDLNQLCRQVPGGDLVTPAHWKKAVQAAGYLQKANDIYSYLLPIFSPVPGLARLGTQQWMVKPAWKNMQQNLLRWFYRTYVNRLGTHLVELYSGRLVIGVAQYRKLTRKSHSTAQGTNEGVGVLTIMVAGARSVDKAKLVSALDQARSGDLALVKARLASTGLDESLVDRLKSAKLVEIAGYTASPQGESARDRSTRRDAVEAAVEADLLVLVIDAGLESNAADVAFAEAWDRWFVEHPGIESPPAMVVAVGVGRIGLEGDGRPSLDWMKREGLRESGVRGRLESLRAALPPSISEMVAVGPGEENSTGIAESVLPALGVLIHRAERAALIRQLHHISTRSKARRLAWQVGQQGRKVWNHLRSGHKGHHQSKT